MEERKKSGAEKAVDRAEAKARDKMLDAIAAWIPMRRAQHELAKDVCADLDAAAELLRAIEPRLPS
jgi:hypothetical protein